MRPSPERTNVASNPDEYPIKEVAEMFHVNTVTVMRWIRQGKLKAFKRRNYWYVYHADLQAYAQQEVDGKNDRRFNSAK
jgi:excisionase family DNA binding protein